MIRNVRLLETLTKSGYSAASTTQGINCLAKGRIDGINLLDNGGIQIIGGRKIPQKILQYFEDSSSFRDNGDKISQNYERLIKAAKKKVSKKYGRAELIEICNVNKKYDVDIYNSLLHATQKKYELAQMYHCSIIRIEELGNIINQASKNWMNKFFNFIGF